MSKKAKGSSSGFLKVAVLFLVVAGVLNSVVSLLVNAGYLDFLVNSTTGYSAYLINLIGISAPSLPNRIFLKSRVFDVTFECTAVYIATLYSSLVITYPVSIRRKLMGLVVGIPLIFAVNIVRIVLVAVVSEKLPPYFFDYIHDYLWQVGFILLIAALWLIFAQERKDEVENALHT